MPRCASRKGGEVTAGLGPGRRGASTVMPEGDPVKKGVF